MVRTMFGEIFRGRLARLPFIGAMIGLVLVAVLVSAVIVISVGVAESLVAGDLLATQALVHASIGLPAFLAVALLYLALTFGYFNLIAKRVRDIGLPGWAVVIGWLIAIALLRRSGAEGTVAILSLIALACLLLLPGRRPG